MLLLVEIDEAKVSAAIRALNPFAVREPVLFSPMPLPNEIQGQQDFEERARRIAAGIAPTGNQPMRRQALRAVLYGHDTFGGQLGEADPALRNAVGALSKALRPFSIFSSPVDLLCSREKEYFSDEPFKGRYRGTRYRPTELGIRVREILEEKGVL